MQSRVMIVEDDADLVEVIGEYLELRGFEIVTYGSASEALAALNGGIDALVTDLELGSTGGLYLCEHVSRRFPALPIVVLTGHGEAERAALRLGARRVLTKPADLSELATLLAELIAARPIRAAE